MHNCCVLVLLCNACDAVICMLLRIMRTSNTYCCMFASPIEVISNTCPQLLCQKQGKDTDAIEGVAGSETVDANATEADLHKRMVSSEHVEVR